MAVKQSEFERGVLGVLIGLVLGALAGLLARSEEKADGGPWAARSKT